MEIKIEEDHDKGLGSLSSILLQGATLLVENLQCGNRELVEEIHWW